MSRKPLVGSIKTDPTNGFEHLPLVPGVTEILADPRVRAHLLLLEWEGEAPSSIPLPHGPPVHFSKKCADRANSPIGLGFTAALVRAAVLEEEARRAL